tara:strand:+ start:722 stop:1021 length:300 start_codon:yes stop_codon:yes gene_type:complete
MSEGALEYTLIKETKVNVEVSDIINELASIVDDKLDGYYLYDSQPHLSNDDDGDSITVYLSDDDYVEGSPVEWKPLFTKAIKRLAQDIADGIEERGPVE